MIINPSSIVSKGQNELIATCHTLDSNGIVEIEYQDRFFIGNLYGIHWPTSILNQKKVQSEFSVLCTGKKKFVKIYKIKSKYFFDIYSQDKSFRLSADLIAREVAGISEEFTNPEDQGYFRMLTDYPAKFNVDEKQDFFPEDLFLDVNPGESIKSEGLPETQTKWFDWPKMNDILTRFTINLVPVMPEFFFQSPDELISVLYEIQGERIGLIVEPQSDYMIEENQYSLLIKGHNPFMLSIIYPEDLILDIKNSIGKGRFEIYGVIHESGKTSLSRYSYISPEAISIDCDTVISLEAISIVSVTQLYLS